MLPLVALLLLLLAVPSAQARTGPCRVDGGGPRCHVWTGRVTHVADGDGMYVRVAGKEILVRMTGLNAMELTRYSHTPSRRRGACHAREATRALERLVSRARGRVRLAAQDLARTDLGRRVRRHVALRIGGRWVDAAQRQLEAGHALWLPSREESAWNGVMRAAALRGAASGRNLYDPAYCGAGPAAEVQVSVNWDADGNDRENLNGEYVRVRNLGSAPVALGGWWIRDSALRFATFPAGAVVDAGDSVRLHVGRGSSGGRDFYWGLSAPAFENDGDGGYLFDPQGDLRAYEIY